MDSLQKQVEEAIKKLDEMTHGSDGKGQYGPTGAGDDWVRIGPFKVLLDGGMLIGTAFMREPWGAGGTYQITDPKYRGILNVKPELLNPLYLEAAKRGWQLTAHCTGEASVDVLLDCYAAIHRQMDIRHRRFEICHASRHCVSTPSTMQNSTLRNTRRVRWNGGSMRTSSWWIGILQSARSRMCGAQKCS